MNIFYYLSSFPYSSTETVFLSRLAADDRNESTPKLLLKLHRRIRKGIRMLEKLAGRVRILPWNGRNEVMYDSNDNRQLIMPP
jgi:hypothetical protein